MEGNWTRRGKRIERVLCHSQGRSEASWYSVCSSPTLIVCAHAHSGNGIRLEDW